MSFQVKVRRNEAGLITYVNAINTYHDAQMIPGQCNSISFINQGTSLAVINGALRLNPQQSITIDGNSEEWDNTNYNISFDTSIGTANNLVVVRKVYQ